MLQSINCSVNSHSFDKLNKKADRKKVSFGDTKYVLCGKLYPPSNISNDLKKILSIEGKGDAVKIAIQELVLNVTTRNPGKEEIQVVPIEHLDELHEFVHNLINS